MDQKIEQKSKMNEQKKEKTGMAMSGQQERAPHGMPRSGKEQKAPSKSAPKK